MRMLSSLVLMSLMCATPLLGECYREVVCLGVGDPPDGHEAQRQQTRLSGEPAPEFPRSINADQDEKFEACVVEADQKGAGEKLPFGRNGLEQDFFDRCGDKYLYSILTYERTNVAAPYIDGKETRTTTTNREYQLGAQFAYATGVPGTTLTGTVTGSYKEGDTWTTTIEIIRYRWVATYKAIPDRAGGQRLGSCGNASKIKSICVSQPGD